MMCHEDGHHMILSDQHTFIQRKKVSKEHENTI